tara:strand:+ start:269 stop:706 length:438 start_codon:yes stop_codon:yes gene_type:complete
LQEYEVPYKYSDEKSSDRRGNHEDKRLAHKYLDQHLLSASETTHHGNLLRLVINISSHARAQRKEAQHHAYHHNSSEDGIDVSVFVYEFLLEIEFPVRDQGGVFVGEIFRWRHGREIVESTLPIGSPGISDKVYIIVLRVDFEPD